MGEIESENPAGTLPAFPPHNRRRRHLNSGTYRTWVRILSHCYDELNQDNGSNELGKETDNEVRENVELVVPPDGMKPKNSDVKDVRVGDETGCDDSGFRDKLEQIESILSVDENEDFLKMNDEMDIENILAIDFEELGIDSEQMLMNEPDWIVKGNEDGTPNPSATSLDRNRSGSDQVALLTGQEEDDETVRSESVAQRVSGTHDSSLNAFVTGESLSPRELNEREDSVLETNTLDVEPIMQRKAMEVEASVSAKGAKDMVAQASNPTEYSKEESFSGGTNSLEVEHEMQQMDKELEKMACTTTAMNSPNHMNHEDIEEGEISGDDGMDDRSFDVLLDDTVVLEEKDVREEHLRIKANDKDFGSKSVLADMVDEGTFGSRGEKLRESTKTELIRIPGVVQGISAKADSHPLLEGGRIEMKDNGVGLGTGCAAAGNLGTTSEEKWDDGASKKRKRGPLTKEKKERKKAKERKKRAQKERELGVKKLRLQPIQKPKVVTYCRHYVRGRCHEGDKCKFSHDTVPLTKSMPCVHFARQSCMKGNDCQYDHELSKYPCNNFKDNGFCSRSDRCMFSHKIPPKEDSATAACKPELKPPAELSNSRSPQVNIGGASQQNVHALASSVGIHSRYNTKQNVTETVLKQPKLATKGISFPSISKSPLVHSSMSKQGGLAPDSYTGAKAENPIDQSPLSSVQRSTEMSKRTPPVTTPKGINFLSFGKPSPDDARGKNQVGHQTSSSVSEIIQNMNGMIKANQLAASHGTIFNPFKKSSVASSSSELTASQGTNFNPFGKSLVVGSSCELATSQGTNFNPFGKSSVASSSCEPAAPQGTNINPFGKSLVVGSCSEPAASQGTNFNPIGKSSVASSSSEPAVLQETNSNPFGKSSVSCSSGEKLVSYPSSWENGRNRDSRESPNTADKPQSSSVITLRLPPSPLASGQSSDRMASRFCKDTANSFQRGLFSTLAFAEKYKTQNTIQSIGSAGTQR